MARGGARLGAGRHIHISLTPGPETVILARICAADGADRQVQVLRALKALRRLIHRDGWDVLAELDAIDETDLPPCPPLIEGPAVPLPEPTRQVTLTSHQSWNGVSYSPGCHQVPVSFAADLEAQDRLTEQRRRKSPILQDRD